MKKQTNTNPQDNSDGTGQLSRDQAKAETHAKLVRAGLRLFAQIGYDATSVKQIAQEAGVAQGLLYHYFASKEKLLQAIFQASMEDVRRSFAESIAAGASGKGLEVLIRSSFQIVQENQEFWRLSYAVRMQPAVLGDVAGLLSESTGEILRTLEGFLQESGYPEPAVEAAILFATIDGISQHYTMMPDTYPLPAVVERLVAHYPNQHPNQHPNQRQEGV